MSVSFVVASEVTDYSTVAYRVTCDCVESQSITLENSDALTAFLTDYRENPVKFEGCTDEVCVAYSPVYVALDGTEGTEEMNVSNSNGGFLLRTIRLQEDFDYGIIGEAAPEQVITQIDKWMGNNTGNLLGDDCEYLEGRLNQLREIAVAAQEMDSVVQWG